MEEDHNHRVKSRSKFVMFFYRGLFITSVIATTTFGLMENTVADIYTRSGYICGVEPPTQEEIAARSAIPMCLNINTGNTTSYADDQLSNRPLCLQAGALDKPAVWCTNAITTGLRYPSPVTWPSIFLWWSPCDKCGTAWRIFDSQDNDKSWFKRPTSPQPNSSVIPSEDGWLEWVREDGWLDSDYTGPDPEWKDTSISISISECYSDSGTDGGTSTNSTTNYTIPSACYSDKIYAGRNLPYDYALEFAIMLMLVSPCTFLMCCVYSIAEPSHVMILVEVVVEEMAEVEVAAAEEVVEVETGGVKYHSEIIKPTNIQQRFTTHKHNRDLLIMEIGMTDSSDEQLLQLGVQTLKFFQDCGNKDKPCVSARLYIQYHSE